MAELAVLGILLGLWRALAGGDGTGLRRDHLETTCGWLLVGVSVLLAVTAAFPNSVTDLAGHCQRVASCAEQPQAQEPPRLTRAPGADVPGSPMPVQVTG
jgi:hypothetical protein